MSDFGAYFNRNMNSLGVPTPGTLVGNLGAALASAKVLADAIEKYGPAVTAADLARAGLASEKIGVIMALGAAAYLGAVVGSIAVATGKCIADDLSPLIYDPFQKAIQPPRRDPLAIDLDGDGIETVGIGNTPILFDHNGDGIKTGTGWLKGDDAWLVMDRNGNGQIDSGAELFGVDTQITVNGITRTARDGFEALKTLDGNNDGFSMSMTKLSTASAFGRTSIKTESAKPTSWPSCQQKSLPSTSASSLGTMRIWATATRSLAKPK